MRKRNHHVQIWLNDEEIKSLTERAKGCGYSREAYIRSILNGHIPRPMPPPDYHAMIRELHAIGNNLNQVAQKAHVLNVIDAARYNNAVQQFADTLLRIERAVKLPVEFE